MGTLPRDTSHRIQHNSNTAPSHSAHPSGTAPAQPHRWQLPQPSWPTTGSFPRAAALAQDAPVWVTRDCASFSPHGCAVGSSMATHGAVLCAVSVGCSGTACSSWASPGLQGTAALYLEHFLPSSCTDPGGCRAASPSSLTPLSQMLLHSCLLWGTCA